MIAVARTLLIFAGLALGGRAFAEPLLLSPLASDASVDAKQRQMVYDTLAAELDFYPGFDFVIQLPSVPAALTPACSKRASCLAQIAADGGAEALVAGTVRRRGRLFWLELVYFDHDRIERAKTFSVPTDPSGLADAIGPVVRELLTGHTAADDAPKTVDLDFDDIEDPDEPGFDAPAPPPRQDTKAIRFGQADVQTAPLDEGEEALPAEGSAAAAAPGRPEVTPPRDRAAEREAKRRLRERERDARTASAPARASGGPSGAPNRPSVWIAGRLGGSKYYTYNFLTTGAEVSLRMSDGVHFVAGVDAYSVNLALTPEQQVELGRLRYWDQIFPIHLGFVYRFAPDAKVRPYAGLEVIFAQYYVDEVGADWAGGPRLRGGIDWMIVDQFGLELDLAVGGWMGQNWPYINASLKPVGLLPQLSIGPVVAF